MNIGIAFTAAMVLAHHEGYTHRAFPALICCTLTTPDTTTLATSCQLHVPCWQTTK